MRLPITIDLRNLPNALDVINQAVSIQAPPRDWRLSEYAMTKVTAKAVVASLRESGLVLEADYFDWSCLTGELARLYQHLRRTYTSMNPDDPLAEEVVNQGAAALHVFSHIHRQCLADPAVAEAIAEAEEYEAEKKRLEKKRIEKMEARFRQRELEFRQRNQT